VSTNEVSRIKAKPINPKLGLFIFLTLVLVVSRVTENLSEPLSRGKIEFSGEVASSPYVRGNKLQFRVGKYLVSSDYLELNLGDKVRVGGEVEEGKVIASEVERLPLSALETTSRNVRDNLSKKIYAYFADPQASLLAGITLGLDQLPKDFKENLIITGTIHVVVVSGYNIALVGGFFLVSAPYIGRKKASLLAIAAIICYTLLVGVSAPTLRAAVIGIVTLVGLLLGRKALALYSLGLAGAAMLVINPNFLTDISFQLSFLATLGIIAFTKPISSKLTRVHGLFRESIATTIAAQILVLPVLFYHFGTVSLLSPLVNSLVLWLIPLVTIGGFIFLVASFINNLLAQGVGLILLAPLFFFTYLVNEFAKLKFLFLEIGGSNWLLAVGYYSLVLSFLLRQKVKARGASLEAVWTLEKFGKRDTLAFG